MPRRGRKQLVGRREDREHRERERELELLAGALRREWRWMPRPVRRREAA
ncbi:MAG: hypothetical protein M3R09_00330 [Actinomycetota bacterium]|nr:hypothetical protein [Actinomycetota bacterium]